MKIIDETLIPSFININKTKYYLNCIAFINKYNFCVSCTSFKIISKKNSKKNYLNRYYYTNRKKWFISKITFFKDYDLYKSRLDMEVFETLDEALEFLIKIKASKEHYIRTIDKTPHINIIPSIIMTKEYNDYN